MLPSCPLPRKHGLQGFRAPGPREHNRVVSGPSRGLRLLFRGCPSTEPLHRAPGSPGARRPVQTARLFCSSSLEVSTPSAFPRPGQRHDGWAYLAQPPAPLGSRNLVAPSSAPSLPALFHAGSALGVTLQSFLPPAQPYAVPSAVPLLAFAPPSGFCSARESATRVRGLAWKRARSSPGFFSLQGTLSSCVGLAFTSPPLVWFTRSGASDCRAPLQGVARRRLG
jgi:hypothetical protein